MKDTPDSRAEIARLLKHTERAERIGIGRFRRHTLGSRIGNVVDKVVDEFAGPEGGEGTAGRDAPCGMRVWVYEQGACVHEWELHPTSDDFEQALLPHVVSAARRLSASFEVYVEGEPVFTLDASWWLSQLSQRSESGYRDAPARNELPALPDSYYAWTDDGMSYHRRWSPSFLFMPILVLLLVTGFPIVALLMLVPDARRALLGIARSVFFGREVRWTWTRSGGTWRVDLKDNGTAANVALQAQDVLLFLPMPLRWTAPAGDCGALWAVREQDAVEIPMAMNMDARLIAGAFADAARR